MTNFINPDFFTTFTSIHFFIVHIMPKKNKKLIVILGPTGIGKTDVGIEVAKLLNTEIISSDSRQIYEEMSIGTATPSPKQLNTVKHYLIHFKSIEEYYNASMFEEDALKILEEIFKNHDEAVLVGGSMMYIDTLCNGIDDLPTVDPEIRKNLLEQYEKEGIESIRMEVKKVDPEYYQKADLKNYKRLIHAIEIFYMTGKPYSTFLTHPKKERDFEIVKIGLNTDRELLYNRINKRVELMIEDGLIDEVKRLYPYRHLNALNTVGYREFFSWIDGEISFEEAVEQVKANSRKYARKQLTWFRRDKEIHWFDPCNLSEILNFINKE